MRLLGFALVLAGMLGLIDPRIDWLDMGREQPKAGQAARVNAGKEKARVPLAISGIAVVFGLILLTTVGRKANWPTSKQGNPDAR
jgi:hypothetical protein